MERIAATVGCRLAKWSLIYPIRRRAEGKGQMTIWLWLSIFILAKYAVIAVITDMRHAIHPRNL